MNQAAVEMTSETRIRECVNLDELYDVLRDLDEVQGSKRTYTGEELVEFIQTAAKLYEDGALGVLDQALAPVTNTFDIRDKAHELIAGEPAI